MKTILFALFFFFTTSAEAGWFSELFADIFVPNRSLVKPRLEVNLNSADIGKELQYEFNVRYPGGHHVMFLFQQHVPVWERTNDAWSTNLTGIIAIIQNDKVLLSTNFLCEMGGGRLGG